MSYISVAAKTHFTKQQLKKIMSEYAVGDFVLSKPFKAGYVQTNILIKTTQGKFVLRYYEYRKKESVSFEVDFLKHLNTHKYPCALPIQKRNKKVIGVYKKNPMFCSPILKVITAKSSPGLNYTK